MSQYRDLPLCSLKSASRTKYPIKVLVHFRISPVSVFMSKLDQLYERYLLNKKCNKLWCSSNVGIEKSGPVPVWPLDEKYPQVVSWLQRISDLIRIFRFK